MVLTKKYRIVIKDGVSIFDYGRDFTGSTTYVGATCSLCGQFDTLAEYDTFISVNNIIFNTEDEETN